MRVQVKTWRVPGGVKTMDAYQALTPEGRGRDGGIAESAQSTADAACEAMGRLLEVLLDKGVLTLEEATNVSGVYYDDIQEVK